MLPERLGTAGRRRCRRGDPAGNLADADNSGAVPMTPFQQTFARAGHAHAGVLVTLGIAHSQVGVG
ncbi:hypothetical protein GCM10010116_54630 [Microbispora rosea subsp. aerata]|nr:hypothetical protein GCM10010116_54630 [Microbispora rosea subsp. aerata]GIH57615.1 hypothetical protein Mro02_45290 [Microbispora rosea subsp. aerata]GLJ86793.1 hypothetical protein GCM10017588_55340 [Microbispora rosea subsp. aerata]